MFGALLSVILLLGFASSLESLNIQTLPSAWAAFIDHSGIIALITALTAFIALYRLRHWPDKKRPAVREDYGEKGDTESFDFGLRNYGPGPALYLQAVVTVEKEDTMDTVYRFTPHDTPIHLEEGEFASLLQEAEEDWLEDMLNKYGSEQARDGNPARVNLYYSYVSQTGAREPTYVSASREDENILTQIKQPDSEARHIELWRLKETYQTES